MDIPAGAESSYSQPNHTYPITLHAKDAAGNETVMEASDPTYGDELNIRVLEKTKPTVTIVSPTQGSVLGSATQDIVMELQDAGGSGLNMASVVFKVNNVQVSSGLSGRMEQTGRRRAPITLPTCQTVPTVSACR